MLEINVTIQCPDFIRAAEMLTGMKPTTERNASAPIAVTNTPAQAPITPMQVPTAPVAQAPVFTVAQIATAGANLLASNPGMQPALVELIRKYGVQTVQELPKDKLGAFATELRQMGARI